MEERMVSRLGRFLGALALVLSGVGCGGRSVPFEPATEGDRSGEVDGSGAPRPSESSPPAPLPDPPAGSPTPPEPLPDPPVPSPAPTAPLPPPERPTEPEPVPCGELTARVELAWVQVTEDYGLEGPGMLSFSPDGARVATVGGSYDPAVVLLDVETGTSVWHEVDEIVFGRDAAWRVELRGHDRALHALDLLSGGDVFYRDLEGVLRGAAVSGDGRFVGALTCRDGLLVASRWALGSDATHEVPLQPCDSLSLDHAFLLTRAGEAALVAAGTDGSVARVDFEHGTVTRAALHTRTDVTPSVFGLALSPDGTKGISAGTDAVRAWSHPELTPSFDPVPSTIGPTFTNCYTQSRYLSALAFSPDGSLLTTPAEVGTLTIRRSCDLAPVATLERPLEPFCSYRGTAPAGLATFSPAGDRLAVWWAGVVGMYRVVRP